MTKCAHETVNIQEDRIVLLGESGYSVCYVILACVISILRGLYVITKLYLIEESIKQVAEGNRNSSLIVKMKHASHYMK